MPDSSLNTTSSGRIGESWAETGQYFESVDTGRRIGGVPVYGFRREPGAPPIGIGNPAASGEPPRPLPHAHDFLVLGFVVRGHGGLVLNGRRWDLRTGDLFLVAPGEVVDVDHDTDDMAQAWTVSFSPDAIGPRALRAWRAHPLLGPFVRAGGGVQRLPVPEPDRARFAGRLAELDAELRSREDGYGDAATALLTLLLVDVTRLATDVPAGLRLRDEPLLADVFALIEQRFTEPISLRDVAAAVALTPAHLTTVVRRKTGRTVQQWITERRLSEARRLLADTDLTVTAIAARTGFTDPGYFIRTFRREHDRTPQVWRARSRQVTS